eukprot:3283118-Alexandrium_andersonii.AAC.1
MRPMQCSAVQCVWLCMCALARACAYACVRVCMCDSGCPMRDPDRFALAFWCRAAGAGCRWRAQKCLHEWVSALGPGCVAPGWGRAA